MICTFFGHRDTPESARPVLSAILRELIVSEGVHDFLVGHQGAFDRMVLRELKKLKAEFRDVRYAIVLAYLSNDTPKWEADMETVYPEGLETVPKRFAISRRNDWMLKQADVVVVYVTHRTGGAATYVQKAIRQGKRIISAAPDVRISEKDDSANQNKM